MRAHPALKAVQRIQRTTAHFRYHLRDMQVHDRRAQVAVAQQVLDCVNINPVFQKVRSKTMPERMHRYCLADIRFLQGFGDHVLDTTLAHHLAGCLPFEEIGLWLHFGQLMR